MKWVYILRCEEDIYYVGETSRLYRRFWEHNSGNGGINTSNYSPIEIIAIYKVNTLGKFFEYNTKILDAIEKTPSSSKVRLNSWFLKNFNEIDYDYDNLVVENNIAERLMFHNKDNWKKIRGGKYTRNIEYKFPVNEYIKELPICKCGLPCDIKTNDNNYLFFRCSKKNMWESFKEHFDVEEPCNFFMEYTKDKEFRLEESKNIEERKIILKKLFQKSHWLKNVSNHDFCIGCCISEYKKILYNDKEISLCFDCFIDKNEELSQKYKYSGKCLIKID